MMKLKKYFESNSDVGLFILRLGIGIAFIFIHGLPKFKGGTETLAKVGGAMGNFGITFAPVFWGTAAASVEVAGGALLILGLFTRSTAALLAFVMVTAVVQQFAAGAAWMVVFHPIKMLVVFLALLFTGPGNISIDAKINRKV